MGTLPAYRPLVRIGRRPPASSSEVDGAHTLLGVSPAAPSASLSGGERQRVSAGRMSRAGCVDAACSMSLPPFSTSSSSFTASTVSARRRPKTRQALHRGHARSEPCALTHCTQSSRIVLANGGIAHDLQAANAQLRKSKTGLHLFSPRSSHRQHTGRHSPGSGINECASSRPFACRARRPMCSR